MATSRSQDRAFSIELMEFLQNDDVLGKAIEWIGGNLSPEDVFAERDLEAWAADNGWVKEE